MLATEASPQMPTGNLGQNGVGPHLEHRSEAWIQERGCGNGGHWAVVPGGACPLRTGTGWGGSLRKCHPKGRPKTLAEMGWDPIWNAARERGFKSGMRQWRPLGGGSGRGLSPSDGYGVGGGLTVTARRHRSCVSRATVKARRRQCFLRCACASMTRPQSLRQTPRRRTWTRAGTVALARGEAATFGQRALAR